MAHLLRDRDTRPVLKVELTNAIKMCEKMRHYVWWN